MRVWECVQENVSGRGTRMRTPLKQRAWCVHELRTGMAELSEHRGRGVSHTGEGDRLDQIRCDLGLCSKTSGKTLERCE